MLRIVVILALVAAGAFAQDDGPYEATDVERAQIAMRAADLGAAVDKLRATGVDPELAADVEIYHKALVWLDRYPEETYRRTYVHDALNVAAAGEARAAALLEGERPWVDAVGTTVVRGYRSEVDGSVQPYAVHVPAGYDPEKPMRLDVVLHGRNARLSEVSFIAGHERGGTDDPGYLVLEVFGRTNNAYRWAGETDVFEALAAVRRNYAVDPARVVLRGFSMGGAGTWHIGLHHPDEWVAIEAGAGFTDTLVYARNSLPEVVTDYQKATMRIYDAVVYSWNTSNIPATVGYGGEVDPQLQASVNIRMALAERGVAFQQDGMDSYSHSPKTLFLVGPGAAHRFIPESKAESNAFIDPVVERGRETPALVAFRTFTTRYADSDWVTVDGLERMYEPAEVQARRRDESIEVSTENVSRLVLDDVTGVALVTVDGQDIVLAEPHGSRAFLGKTSPMGWQAYASLDELRGEGLVKRPGLQGPIDDAFTSAFVAVRPTSGTTPELERFEKEFPKWLRADVPVVDGAEIDDDLIASKHLVLFGDAKTNPLIAKVADRLPIRVQDGAYHVGGKAYPAAEHTLALIYPNPLNPDKYVVLNSGHTFGEHEFRGTNALLYPRWGDWAILGPDGEPVAAGLFDEDWQLQQ